MSQNDVNDRQIRLAIVIKENRDPDLYDFFSSLADKSLAATARGLLQIALDDPDVHEKLADFNRQQRGEPRRSFSASTRRSSRKPKRTPPKPTQGPHSTNGKQAQCPADNSIEKAPAYTQNHTQTTEDFKQPDENELDQSQLASLQVLNQF